MNFAHRVSLVLAWLAAGLAISQAAETEIRYLSGHGPKDAVPWEFTVTKGRRAGEKTTIPVPSNWEQQGFGSYNYGQGSPDPKANEHGLYRLEFSVPESWNGRQVRIVFDGVMTDAEVKINGQLAGPVHQGGFYRFRHDITALLKPGRNLLEVEVSKVSANKDTERAERGGDYWVFGGIYRQVFLEAVPKQAIEQVSINATADGNFTAAVECGNAADGNQVEAQILTSDGKPLGQPVSTAIPANSAGLVTISTKIDAPKLWTAETPNLYQARFTLRKDGVEIHTITQRFGFRTFELRQGAGFFLNGKRILLKGVCRHSFRPETGRALDPQDCQDDVRLIKEMHMNAVRMSHYPPDVAFLEACDELGLYVLDELSGWQHAHDTEVGKKLVREMVRRDVNHPSILFWDNGNEGGWNRALDGEFALYDPQQRIVLHPWELMNGVDTKHYPSFDDLSKRLAGPNMVMPTEMIHALYDGGGGAGLEDYWKAISTSPVGGGGFIWVFADEGIKRTDQGGRIDVFSTYAPDGLVGPHHEKEGSFYTVRDIYSPVQIDAPVLDGKFTGKLTVHNSYDFLPLSGCHFRWRLLHFSQPSKPQSTTETLATGNASAPAVEPHQSGELALELPATWQDADALSVSASDAMGRELWTWTWPTVALGNRAAGPVKVKTKPSLSVTPRAIQLQADKGNVSVSFDAQTGTLKSFRRYRQISALTNGPRLVFARPTMGDIHWVNAPLDPATRIWKAETPQRLNLLEIEMDLPKNHGWAGFKLELSADGTNWTTRYDGTRRGGDGNKYEFPPQIVAAVRLSNFRQESGKPVVVKTLRTAYQAERFPSIDKTLPKLSSGTNPDASVWLESVAADDSIKWRWTLTAAGDLRLDYSYQTDGTFIYQGITFDHPEEQFKAVKWLGEGPSRVWQNRLRGTTLGVHEIARNDNQPGETWQYPEFQGCFAGPRWARFDTASAPLTVFSVSPGTFLRIGTPRISHPGTSVAFPPGDLSFLKVIPAIGSKFLAPEKTGPASQAAKVIGLQSGSLVFRLGD